MSTWTPERVETLRRLRTVVGLSAKQIAEALGGVSRNAVIAKMDREGIEVPAHLRRNRNAQAALVGNRNKNGRKRAAKPAQRIDPFAKMKREPVVSRRAPKKGASSMRWTDHIDGKHCAMFCEGEGGDEGFVCGAPTLPGKEWCSNCFRVVYPPVAKKEAA